LGGNWKRGIGRVKNRETSQSVSDICNIKKEGEQRYRHSRQQTSQGRKGHGDIRGNFQEYCPVHPKGRDFSMRYEGGNAKRSAKTTIKKAKIGKTEMGETGPEASAKMKRAELNNKGGKRTGGDNKTDDVFSKQSNTGKVKKKGDKNKHSTKVTSRKTNNGSTKKPHKKKKRVVNTGGGSMQTCIKGGGKK